MTSAVALHDALQRQASRPEHAGRASSEIRRWLQAPDFAPYQPLLRALIERERWDLLLDSFYRVLPFGTGGRRGPVGIGSNRINPWTIGTSVCGHVAFLRARFGTDLPLRVVVAADVRVFADLRGAFPRDVPNPLLGVRSIDLARDAAAIYTAHGVEVWMEEPGQGRFTSTPELSFLIRRLGAHGGLNISASHNHPDDNGGKFYTETGAQEVPPHDERMVELVERVDGIRTMPWEEALASGLVRFVDPALHQRYLEAASTVLRTQSRGAVVVFTNLHGTGDQTAGEALRAAGFTTHGVEAQLAHDGAFPQVRFRAPNPEYPEAFDLAIETARAVDADLILATDPDADRIGAMAKDGRGGYRFFTGNELSCLVADARFDGARPGSIGVRTEVTTGLFSRIVSAAGGQVIDHLLVGCKYIAQVMQDLETTGRSGAVTGGVDDVLIGTEESHGFLLTPREMRDKDGAAPALVLAELASMEQSRGRTLVDRLQDLYLQHGAWANMQIPLVMAGAAGRQRIEAIQAALRATPPRAIDGRGVTAFFDRQDVNGPFGAIVSETDRSSRDVLVFQCGPSHRIVIRPSGTEPKTKIYAEARVAVAGDLDAAMAAANAEAEALAADFVRQALDLIGLQLAEAGLFCSPLLGVDERIEFADRVLPEAVDRASRGEDPASLRSWLRERVGRWGGDGVGLCAPGWRRVRAGQPEAVQRVLDGAFAR